MIDTITILVMAYLIGGWFVGLPLGATLDYLLYDPADPRPKISIGASVMIWPLTLLIALILLPCIIRDGFHNKIDALPKRSNRNV